MATYLVNDPFVIYENYVKLRNFLTKAVYRENLEEITATIQVKFVLNTVIKMTYLILGTY